MVKGSVLGHRFIVKGSVDNESDRPGVCYGANLTSHGGISMQRFGLVLVMALGLSTVGCKSECEKKCDSDRETTLARLALAQEAIAGTLDKLPPDQQKQIKDNNEQAFKGVDLMQKRCVLECKDK
jgi:hypothetical protein